MVSLATSVVRQLLSSSFPASIEHDLKEKRDVFAPVAGHQSAEELVLRDAILNKLHVIQPKAPRTKSHITENHPLHTKHGLHELLPTIAVSCRQVSDCLTEKLQATECMLKEEEPYLIGGAGSHVLKQSHPYEDTDACFYITLPVFDQVRGHVLDFLKIVIAQKLNYPKTYKDYSDFDLNEINHFILDHLKKEIVKRKKSEELLKVLDAAMLDQLLAECYLSGQNVFPDQSGSCIGLGGMDLKFIYKLSHQNVSSSDAFHLGMKSDVIKYRDGLTWGSSADYQQGLKALHERVMVTKDPKRIYQYPLRILLKLNLGFSISNYDENLKLAIAQLEKEIPASQIATKLHFLFLKHYPGKPLARIIGRLNFLSILSQAPQKVIEAYCPPIAGAWLNELTENKNSRLIQLIKVLKHSPASLPHLLNLIQGLFFLAASKNPKIQLYSDPKNGHSLERKPHHFSVLTKQGRLHLAVSDGPAKLASRTVQSWFVLSTQHPSLDWPLLMRGISNELQLGSYVFPRTKPANEMAQQFVALLGAGAFPRSESSIGDFFKHLSEQEVQSAEMQSLARGLLGVRTGETIKLLQDIRGKKDKTREGCRRSFLILHMALQNLSHSTHRARLLNSWDHLIKHKLTPFVSPKEQLQLAQEFLKANGQSCDKQMTRLILKVVIPLLLSKTTPQADLSLAKQLLVHLSKDFSQIPADPTALQIESLFKLLSDPREGERKELVYLILNIAFRIDFEVGFLFYKQYSGEISEAHAKGLKQFISERVALKESMSGLAEDPVKAMQILYLKMQKEVDGEGLVQHVQHFVQVLGGHDSFKMMLKDHLKLKVIKEVEKCLNLLFSHKDKETALSLATAFLLDESAVKAFLPFHRREKYLITLMELYCRSPEISSKSFTERYFKELQEDMPFMNFQKQCFSLAQMLFIQVQKEKSAPHTNVLQFLLDRLKDFDAHYKSRLLSLITGILEQHPEKQCFERFQKYLEEVKSISFESLEERSLFYSRCVNCIYKILDDRIIESEQELESLRDSAQFLFQEIVKLTDTSGQFATGECFKEYQLLKICLLKSYLVNPSTEKVEFVLTRLQKKKNKMPLGLIFNHLLKDLIRTSNEFFSPDSEKELHNILKVMWSDAESMTLCPAEIPDCFRQIIALMRKFLIPGGSLKIPYAAYRLFSDKVKLIYHQFSHEKCKNRELLAQLKSLADQIDPIGKELLEMSNKDLLGIIGRFPDPIPVSWNGYQKASSDIEDALRNFKELIPLYGRLAQEQGRKFMINISQQILPRYYSLCGLVASTVSKAEKEGIYGNVGLGYKSNQGKIPRDAGVDRIYIDQEIIEVGCRSANFVLTAVAHFCSQYQTLTRMKLETILTKEQELLFDPETKFYQNFMKIYRRLIDMIINKRDEIPSNETISYIFDLSKFIDQFRSFVGVAPLFQHSYPTKIYTEMNADFNGHLQLYSSQTAQLLAPLFVTLKSILHYPTLSDLKRTVEVIEKLSKEPLYLVSVLEKLIKIFTDPRFEEISSVDIVLKRDLVNHINILASAYSQKVKEGISKGFDYDAVPLNLVFRMITQIIRLNFNYIRSLNALKDCIKVLGVAVHHK